jgi:hypothetical protein
MIDVDLGADRDIDTREATAFFAKITQVREALRGMEITDIERGVDDR